MISAGTSLEFYCNFPYTNRYVCAFVCVIYKRIGGNRGLMAGSQFILLISGISSSCVCMCATSLRYWQEKSWQNHQRFVWVFACQDRSWRPRLWVGSGSVEKAWYKLTVRQSLGPRGGKGMSGSQAEKRKLFHGLEPDTPWFCFPQSPSLTFLPNLKELLLEVRDLPPICADGGFLAP